jgi:Na+/H+-dicarboxylate symporter
MAALSPTTRILIGLTSGLVSGAVLAATLDAATFASVRIAIDPVGSLWLNALRMPIVPLIVSLLITGAASATDAATSGPIGRRTIATFALMLSASVSAAAIAVPAILAWLPVDAATTAALRDALGRSQPAAPVPPLGEWLVRIVPANPVRAAAEGEVLPLVVFALCLGLAAARIESGLRDRLLGFFKAVAETMMVLVGWVLWTAPLGVLALAFPLGATAGLAGAGALAYYVILLSVIAIAVSAAVYLAVVLGTRVPLGSFARAAAPAQAVAFSTQSSLACLPPMIEAAQVRLALTTRLTGFVLPLAVAVFRVSGPALNLTAALFAAALFGVEMTPARIAAGAVVAIVTSMGAVGLPGQVSFLGAVGPICLAIGAPLEPLALFIAVDTIPDIFRTVANVTGDMGAVAIVADGIGEEREPGLAAPGYFSQRASQS